MGFEFPILVLDGMAVYQRSQAFFGFDRGPGDVNWVWLIIDYFTGKVGNSPYWVRNEKLANDLNE